MDINIREIFESDLDPNSTAWWSSDKVDKINYNFGQVSTGGVRGPQGYTGVNGEPGVIGNIGPVGWQGAKGSQGLQGAPGVNLWDYANPTALSGAGYLFAKRHTGSLVQYTAPIIKIGTSNTSTGYTVPGGIYDAAMESNVNLTSPTSSTIETNLRLQHKHDAATNYFDWKLLGTTDTIQAGRVSNAVKGLTIEHEANITDNVTWNSVAGTKIHHVNEQVSWTTHAARMNRHTSISSGKLFHRYNSWNPQDQVLSSVDGAGKIRYVNVRTIIPSYPIGSIISIREADFNNPAHFHRDEIITQDLSLPILPLLDNRYGSGMEGNIYEGWYLCNGKQWVDPSAPMFSGGGTLTPNLNGFDYFIEANGGLQQQRQSLGNNNVIVGGYDISFKADQAAGPGIYFATFDNIFDDNDASNFTRTLFSEDLPLFGPSDAYVTGEIHIVYLGQKGLVWRDPA